MKAITELRYRQCRWPITRTDQHYFCGAVTDGRAYCHAHCKEAYTERVGHLEILTKSRRLWR